MVHMWCMAFRRTVVARLSPMQPSLSQKQRRKAAVGRYFARGGRVCMLPLRCPPPATACTPFHILSAPIQPECVMPVVHPFPFPPAVYGTRVAPLPPLGDCIPFHQTMHTTLPSCQSILLPPTTLHTITDYTTTHVCAQRSAAHDTSWLVSNTRRLRSAGASHSDGALG